MRTLLPDPLPAELREPIERRKRLGQDRRDEAWEGVLHVVPAPSHRHSTLGAQITWLLAPVAERSGLTMSLDFNLGDGENDYPSPTPGCTAPAPRRCGTPRPPS